MGMGSLTLHIHARGGEVRTLVVGNGDHTIGRASTNAIPIDDGILGRHHCILRVTNDRVTVEDTDSASGTYLDGNLTRGPTDVNEGSTISIGSTRIQIVRS